MCAGAAAKAPDSAADASDAGSGANAAREPRKARAKVTRGLVLEKAQLEAEGRGGRPVRVSRWATLGDVEAGGPDEAEERVEVSFVVQRIRPDFRVIGRVQTAIRLECDRCTCLYTSAADGRFEVWLATAPGGEPLGVSEDEAQDLEAVEKFGSAVTKVDLGPHVRDAVYLSLPTKSLCRDDCGGVEIAVGNAANVSVTYGARSEVESATGTEGGADANFEVGDAERVSNNQLLELKRRLERHNK